MKDKILVVLPTYNCEKQIPRVLAKFESVIAYIDTILILNNQSADNTEGAAIESLKRYPNVHSMILRNEQNYGYGGSLKIGFEFAIRQSFDWVIVLNGDDQSSISDFLPFLESENYKNCEVLWGCRFLKESNLMNYSIARMIANRIFNLLFSIAIRKPIHDIGCGVYMYSTKLLRKRFYLNMPDVLYIGSYLRLAHDYYQHNLQEFPIQWSSSDESSSVKAIPQTLAHFKLAWQYFLYKLPFVLNDFQKVEKDFVSNIVYSSIPSALEQFKVSHEIVM